MELRLARAVTTQNDSEPEDYFMVKPIEYKLSFFIVFKHALLFEEPGSSILSCSYMYAAAGYSTVFQSQDK